MIVCSVLQLGHRTHNPGPPNRTLHLLILWPHFWQSLNSGAGFGSLLIALTALATTHARSTPARSLVRFPIRVALHKAGVTRLENVKETSVAAPVWALRMRRTAVAVFANVAFPDSRTREFGVTHGYSIRCSNARRWG